MRQSFHPSLRYDGGIPLAYRLPSLETDDFFREPLCLMDGKL